MPSFSFIVLLTLGAMGSTAVGCWTDEPTHAEHVQWLDAFDGATHGAFLCAWGRDGNDVWVVGGQPHRGAAWHYDGQAWLPAMTPDVPLLNWTHGADDAQWIVGNAGHILARFKDEVNWTLQSSPTDQPLWGVWAASEDEAWAVGGDPIASGEPDPVLLHWHNEEWTRVALPAVDREFRALFKVWGTGPDNVYAIGARGVILHYNGTAWRQQPSGTPRDLVSLWGRGPNDILAVGGRANGVLVRYNGEVWTPKVLDTEPGLNGVWMDTKGRAIVVGGRGRILTVEANRFAYERQDSANQLLLHGVWGTEEGYRVSAGGSLDQNPPWRGIVIEKRVPRE
jgi:hypothetical protein